MSFFTSLVCFSHNFGLLLFYCFSTLSLKTLTAFCSLVVSAFAHSQRATPPSQRIFTVLSPAHFCESFCGDNGEFFMGSAIFCNHCKSNTHFCVMFGSKKFVQRIGLRYSLFKNLNLYINLLLCSACVAVTGGPEQVDKQLSGITPVGDNPSFDIFESTDPWQYQPLFPIAKVNSFFSALVGCFVFGFYF